MNLATVLPLRRVVEWLCRALRQQEQKSDAHAAALCQSTRELAKTNAELAREIAERKRVEQELRQAEAKYRSIVENAVEGIFQSTPDGRYLSVNPALARIYGYETPDALIRSLIDIGGQLYVNPSRRAEFARLLQEHSTVSGFESQVYRRDGQMIWITETARAVCDSNGTLLYYEGTVEDITERKRAEAELHQAKAAEDFALVLLDVQMSEMDGFATTAAIRQQEQGTGAHIPIVAVTAHAMTGDRERCLAAGMDAYLAKPLQAHQLFQVIESLFPSPDHTPALAHAAEPDNAVFDLQAALSRVKGDREMLQEIVGLFFDEMPGLLSALRTAIAHGDKHAIERAAHSLKGTVSSFGAQAAHKVAFRLEMIGRHGDLTHAAAASAELEREMTRLAHALTALQEEGTP